MLLEHCSNRAQNLAAVKWAAVEIKMTQKMSRAFQVWESRMILCMEIQQLMKLNPMIVVKQIESTRKTRSMFFLEHGRRKSKDLKANLRPDLLVDRGWRPLFKAASYFPFLRPCL